MRAIACVVELTMKFRKSKSRLNDSFYESLAKILDNANGRGLAPERISELLSEASGSFIENSIPHVVAALRKGTPKMLHQHRRRHRRFERNLRKRWGTALDLYYAVVVAAEEAGSKFLMEVDAANRDLDFKLIEALAGLHARACRTALEVYHLLASGLPMGALARSRTLHELAVITTFLSDYGARPEYADLGENIFNMTLY